MVGGVELLLTEVFHPENGDRPSAPNVAVLVKASLPDRRQEETMSMLSNIRASGIHMLFIEIAEEMGEDVDTTLQTAVTSMGFAVFVVDRFHHLSSMVDHVANGACVKPGQYETLLKTTNK